MNLLELQRRMAEDVMRPLTPDLEMQPEAAELANSYVKPNDRLTSFDRLEIYNRQYWFRVIGAVAEDFPALNAVLGNKKFDELVLAYLKENPSTSFTLRNLGSKLPQWLAAHPEFSTRRHKLMLDVARLEWAYVEAYDRAALPPLNADDLQRLGADSQLELQPHLQLLDLHYPVDELVLAVRRETGAADIMSNAVSKRKAAPRIRLPQMRRTRLWLAVHRYENSVYYRQIDREAYLLLSALQQGTPLSAALAAAFTGSLLSSAAQAEKIQECFAHAAELGWFCKPQTSR